MDIQQKSKLINDGIALLDKGRFPTAILESVKDKRLRDDIVKRMFDRGGKKFEDLTEKEQASRKAALSAKIHFEDYLQSFMLYKNVSLMLFVVGFVSLFGKNIPNAGITLLISLVLFLSTYNRQLVIKSIKGVAFGYLPLFFLELWLLGYSFATFKGISVDMLESGQGILQKVFSLALPLIYPIARIVVGAFLFIIYQNQSRFLKAKTQFERLHW